MSHSLMAGTKFTDVNADKCSGIETVDLSNNENDYNEAFKNVFAKPNEADKTLYIAYVYVNSGGSKEVPKQVRVTGVSPEKIISLCQKWNKERSKENQLGTT